jgi:hypothetical protein
VATQIGAEALCPQCRDCHVMNICGGGLYPHCYRRGDGFRNPSVYYDDLLRLITHVRDQEILTRQDHLPDRQELTALFADSGLSLVLLGVVASPFLAAGLIPRLLPLAAVPLSRPGIN